MRIFFAMKMMNLYMIIVHAQKRSGLGIVSKKSGRVKKDNIMKRRAKWIYCVIE